MNATLDPVLATVQVLVSIEALAVKPVTDAILLPTEAVAELYVPDTTLVTNNVSPPWLK